MAELNDLIDEIVQKKFVSLEAADAISAIKKLAAEQARTIEILDRDLKESQRKVDGLISSGAASDAKIKAYDAAEVAMQAREKAALKNELDAAHSKDKAELTERLFTTVFRNGVIQRTLAGTIGGVAQYPGQGGGSYVATTPVGRTETETLG